MWKQRRFGKGGEICGIAVEPRRASSSLVITLPGLGQAMSEKNYMFSGLRKILAGHGQRVAQFDYRGHGDSIGELGDATVTTMKRDALEVLSEVTEEHPAERIYLIGHALGAVIALLVADEWKREYGTPCVPVLLAPPLAAFPPKETLFPAEILGKLEQEGLLDSQQLVPGFDYYTLSDFDRRQYDYFSAWGAHMLYLHGQCLSAGMIHELDGLRPAKLIQEYGGSVRIICSTEDAQTQAAVHGLRHVFLHPVEGYRYFYQHPETMDRWIEAAAGIVLNREQGE
ncbi:alpha/beta hydrolase [Paenibacillus sp. FJAT-26967]|uniref:alpha/beta hydrolase n=1 Tax=Paenibacillus sp. FJAT-26967 TaxID=1729690 RepID=UPI0008385A56|nr:alpha/beta fold hydrolase [Paenibacillus sp. FJAT-26967]